MLELDITTPDFPFDKGSFDTEDRHRLYYEQWGNSRGIAILIFPDQPGAGPNEKYKDLLDLSLWRCILIDPRGCGRSNSADKFKNNDTDHILDDTSAVLGKLGIEKVALAGFRWGAGLALLFSMKYPAMVSGMAIGDICLGEKREIDEFLQTQEPIKGIKLVQHVPEEYRANPLGYLHDQMTSPQWYRRTFFTDIWVKFLLENSHFDPAELKIQEERFRSIAHLETYFLKNRFFLEDGYIKANINKVPNVPIIYGLNGISCISIHGLLNFRILKSRLYLDYPQYYGVETQRLKDISLGLRLLCSRL